MIRRAEHGSSRRVDATRAQPERWSPGSVVEELNIIDPLINPAAHAGSESDAFQLVIPSMPGYGFSAKPTTSG